MPLYYKKDINSATKLYVWKVEEDYDLLFSSIELQPISIERLNKFSSTKRKIEFLATRKLLEVAGFKDADLSYRVDGAPILKNKFISISHTSIFVTIIISDKKVGVDIEKNRQQIFRISSKFVNKEEEVNFDISSLEVLSIIWNTKEAMFKLCDKSGIDFKKNMTVTNIDFKAKIIEAKLIFDDEIIKVRGKLDIFSNHTLVYLMIS